MNTTPKLKRTELMLLTRQRKAHLLRIYLLLQSQRKKSISYLSLTLNSSQAYGWREPIDTLNLGLGLKNSFPEPSSVNFRENSKKDKEKK